MTKAYKNQKYGFLCAVFIITLSLIVSLLTEGFAAAQDVRQECLRLHILANSDSSEDQAVKLLVRDALLEKGGDIFTKSLSSLEAAGKILENKKELEGTVDEILGLNGFSYTAEISIVREYFETRQYEDVRLPAGEYLSCKVILGEGKGHNWWCIMFPPLCLPAATKKSEEDVYAVFSEDAGALVTEKSGYKIKFRIVEIVEDIIHYFSR